MQQVKSTLIYRFKSLLDDRFGWKNQFTDRIVKHTFTRTQIAIGIVLTVLAFGSISAALFTVKRDPSLSLPVNQDASQNLKSELSLGHENSESPTDKITEETSKNVTLSQNTPNPTPVTSNYQKSNSDTKQDNSTPITNGQTPAQDQQSTGATTPTPSSTPATSASPSPAPTTSATPIPTPSASSTISSPSPQPSPVMSRIRARVYFHAGHEDITVYKAPVKLINKNTGEEFWGETNSDGYSPDWYFDTNTAYEIYVYKPRDWNGEYCGSFADGNTGPYGTYQNKHMRIFPPEQVPCIRE